MEYYEDSLSYGQIYSDINYKNETELTSVGEVSLYHVGDTSLVIPASYKDTITSDYGGQETTMDTYLLVRPIESVDKIVVDCEIEEVVLLYSDYLDEGMDTQEANAAVNGDYSNAMEETSADDNFTDYSDLTAKLTDDERKAYVDTLYTFNEENSENGDVRFALLDRSDLKEKYPLLACGYADYHAAGVMIYMYDPENKEMVEVGEVGGYGEFLYDEKDGVFLYNGGGQGVFGTWYGEIKDYAFSDILSVYEDDNENPTKYYDGENNKLTEKEYNKLIEDTEDLYPNKDFEDIYYGDMMLINDGNIVANFY